MHVYTHSITSHIPIQYARSLGGVSWRFFIPTSMEEFFGQIGRTCVVVFLSSINLLWSFWFVGYCNIHLDESTAARLTKLCGGPQQHDRVLYERLMKRSTGCDCCRVVHGGRTVLYSYPEFASAEEGSRPRDLPPWRLNAVGMAGGHVSPLPCFAEENIRNC